MQMLWNVLRSVSLFQFIKMGIKSVRCVSASLRNLFHFVILSQDEPECMKYFYKEKVPEWGASTPGAACLCHRFVNRYASILKYYSIQYR